MSNLLKSKFLLGVLVVAVLVVGFAVSAKPVAADCTITSTLRVGSVGIEVQCLQGIVGATADGKFGPMTKASVMAWQAGHGLVADGVVGPLTRAALMGAPTGNFPAGCTSAAGYSTTTGVKCDTGTSAGLPAGCSSTAGYSPLTGKKCDSTDTGSTGPLEGSAGTISSVTQLSQYSGEDVGEGSNDVKVLGLEVKASKDGDVALKSMKVTVAIANASGSRRFDSYADSVSVWEGSTKVGSADAVDFNKDSTGNYSKTIVFDKDAVVRAGDTEKFYVTFDGQANLDSGDINSEVMTMGVESIRYEDGSGVVTTDSTTGVLPLTGVSVDFVSLATAADTDLKITLDSSTPASGTVLVDDSTDTNGVTLLKGKMKLDGTSDVTLDELPITFTATGAANPEAIASSVTLVIDGEEFTETMTAGATPVVVTFDNLDLKISAGDTINFSVKADINDLENGAAAVDFDEGDTLTASLTTTNRAAMVVENSAGDSLTDGTELTGSATGNAQTFYANGMDLTVNSKSVTVTDDGDAATFVSTAEFAWNITIDNVGDSDIYINKDSADIVSSSTAGDVDTLYTIEYSTGAVLTGQGGTIVCSSSNCVSGDSITGDDTAYGGDYNGETFYKIPAGESRTFTITVNGTNQTQAKQVRAYLAGIEWTTDLVDSASAQDASTATINNYNFHLDTDSATAYKLIS